MIGSVIFSYIFLYAVIAEVSLIVNCKQYMRLVPLSGVLCLRSKFRYDISNGGEMSIIGLTA